jgi:hypothetical protein
LEDIKKRGKNWQEIGKGRLENTEDILTFHPVTYVKWKSLLEKVHTYRNVSRMCVSSLSLQ